MPSSLFVVDVILSAIGMEVYCSNSSWSRLNVHLATAIILALTGSLIVAGDATRGSWDLQI